MANTSLPNLTERTATANSDLIHVNSGGTDYKETKANFLSDVNSSITSLNNSLTNSFTMVELMRQLNVPTTDTSYSCDWASYRVLVIAHVFYGNVMSTIVESREHMMISNSGNRVIASTPSNDVQWSVWKNGDNAVWVRASSANAQNGIAIFGLGKIS